MVTSTTMICAMRFLLCLVLIPSLAFAQTYKSDEQTFRFVKLFKGLDHPWSLAFLPDGRMLVTERVGRVSLLTADFKRSNVEGVPRVAASGQGGLLEVALHPRFSENGEVYLSCSGPGDGGASTELLRARLNGMRLEDAKVIFRQQPKTGGGIHFGGRIVFDRAGFLYLTLGERGQMGRAQLGENHHGSRIGEGTSKPGMAQPLYYWVPSIAPSGMAFYTGEQFPKWKGNLFVGALRDQMLVRLVLDGEKVAKEERLLKGVLGRIRDVRNGPDGFIYLLTDESNGVMARLEP